MFPAVLLLTTLLLALSIVATPLQVRSPLVSLSLVKRMQSLGGGKSIVERDRARFAVLEGRSAATRDSTTGRPPASVPLIDQVAGYIAEVGVGSPATTYELIVDTGSSNTWVGAGTPYFPTNTSKNTGQPVAVEYGSGSFYGEEWLDTVTISSNLVITNQSIGVASSSTGFEGVDGILGIGPVDLTEGTLTAEPHTEIPTVTDNLYTQGKIPNHVVGISFAPTTTENSANGEITLGGTDPSKYVGTINYVPLTKTDPAAKYWGINQTIKYGDTTILSEAAGIVDTGTTLLLIASDAFDAYQSATGGTLDSSTGLLKFTPTQYDKLQTMKFHIGSHTYDLTPNAQIWPRSLNSYINGTPAGIYSILQSTGSASGVTIGFINGMSFLQRFYSVFDTTNSRVGFAKTAYTDATTN